MLQAHLKVVGGKNDGKLISLAVRRFLVGREQDCHLRPNTELVSRHHCVFANDGYSVRLRDLGSTNGTFVNDERLRGEVALQPGDRVRIGNLEFEAVLPQSADAMRMEADPVETGSAAELPVPMDISRDDTAVLSSGDTMYDLPVAPAPDGDTAILSPQQAAPGQPQGSQPQGWYPQQPGYGYPPPYPQPEYAGYPQYPQYMPQGYPPPQYPPQGQWGQPNPYGHYPQYQPQPQYQAQPQQQAPQSGGQQGQNSGSNASVPEVRLPEPESTGADRQPVPAAAPKPAGEQKKASDMPSTSAADIIRQYRQRRP